MPTRSTWASAVGKSVLETVIAFANEPALGDKTGLPARHRAAQRRVPAHRFDRSTLHRRRPVGGMARGRGAQADGGGGAAVRSAAGAASGVPRGAGAAVSGAAESSAAGVCCELCW